MNTDKLPQEIRAKIKKNLIKIESLNSSELLAYSKTLNANKESIDINTRNFLYEAIEARQAIINGNQEAVVKNKETAMIKNFIKKQGKENDFHTKTQ